MALIAQLHRWEKPLWLALVVVLFCAPLFVGLRGSDLNNDEAIYAYAVESILETGDWLNPRCSPNVDIVFLEKPPLKFWLIALPMKFGLLPHNEFGFRFWDALFGSVAFLYVFALGRRMAGPLCGLIALFVLCSFHPLWFEHGLRDNVMEASLVLAYCGGVFHFLRWADSATVRAGRRHALTVGLYFVLGFMTKFVAALFLPVILAGASLLVPAIFARVRREWRVWAASSALALVLIGPWFIYQAVHAGHWLWDVMIAEHVIRRMTSTLAPEHLQPWNFYVSAIFARTNASGVFWLAAAGGVLLVVSAVRKHWPEAVAALVWFVVPLILISRGTSKLEYYLYPFLPPFALAAAYFLCWILKISLDPVDRLAKSLNERSAGLKMPRALRITLVLLSVTAAGVAVFTLVYGGFTLRVGAIRLLRNESILRPTLLALVCGFLGARGIALARPALIVLLLMLAPIPVYRQDLERTRIERHPLQSARDCVLDVRAREKRAGRATPELLAAIPDSRFVHPFFFYFREAGFVRADPISDEALTAALYGQGLQRPVLLPVERYRAFVNAGNGGAQGIGGVDTGYAKVYLLLPGPYAACGTPIPNP